MGKVSFTNSVFYPLSAMLVLALSFIFWSGYNKSKSSHNKSISKISLNNKQSDLVLKASLSDKPRKLPLYGFNGNNIKGPSWTNTAFRDSAASLFPKIIRYPGGTNAN